MPYPLCQHIKPNGLQCKSPSLRGVRYCHFHQQHGSGRPRPAMTAKNRAIIALPPLEDANSVQVAIMEITRALLEDRIDLKRAGLLLYALQTASANLKRVNFEPFDLQWRAQLASEGYSASAPPTRERVVQKLHEQIIGAAPELMHNVVSKRPVQSAPASAPSPNDARAPAPRTRTSGWDPEAWLQEVQEAQARATQEFKEWEARNGKSKAPPTTASAP